MPSTFKSIGVRLGSTGLPDVYTVPAGTTVIIESIHAANVVALSSRVSVAWWDSAGGATNRYLASQIPVPANSALELLERKKFLRPGDAIRAVGSAANEIDLTISLIEMS